MTDNNIIELTPFRANLTRALARRGERLLAATDLAAEVASLEPLEAYYIVRDIGLDQALPILVELSHAQMQACVDLDCWHRSDFAADSLDEWLKAFAQAGPETLAKGFFALDHVLQLLFFAQTVTVYDPDTDQLPPEDVTSDTPRVVTPDGFFVLELKTELALQIHPYTLLDALYQYDSGAAFNLLSTVRVDLPLQIEEEALRFRNGRMQDLGFVEPDEAAVLFSRPPAQPGSRPRAPLDGAVTRVPAVYAGPLSATTLLQRALSLVTDQETLARLEQEIVWAINSAVIAYGEKTREIKQITDIAERVRDTISLGLETLLAREEGSFPPDSSAAAGKAVALLDSWCIVDLFRHGFVAAQELQKEVRQAMREPGFRAWYELADPDQSDEPVDRLARTFVAALLGRHPLRGGVDPARADEVTAFASIAEINDARARLQGLVARLGRSA
jgi:hypothetical protein